LSALVPVLAGKQCLGHILRRGVTGFEAFDVDDRSLGVFATQRAAADAIFGGSKIEGDG
jgi:hypothetical protein